MLALSVLGLILPAYLTQFANGVEKEFRHINQLNIGMSQTMSHTL